MSSAVSKRQQQRNEKLLQELIAKVPGNNQCADCRSRNPGTSTMNRRSFGQHGSECPMFHQHCRCLHMKPNANPSCYRMGQLECKKPPAPHLIYGCIRRLHNSIRFDSIGPRAPCMPPESFETR
ncbi:hypothetical protein Dda_3291 [Drechslerella dactyloides]|uniref:Uncharacterized protein n=1 Tax=Drechslerella dactyloides TaxID=74499 RepID=A0AAD6NK75_DREDA|nr:hypothetical protein Dda_3291 [Drechslerella dactyloides]